MKNQLVTILCFLICVSNFASFGNAQSISIPNLLSKLNIASLIAPPPPPPPPPKTQPSISFQIEAAQNAANNVKPQQRTLQDPLPPILSSLRSQSNDGNKQPLIQLPINSGFIAPLNRARFTTDEPETNTHVYVYSTSEENNVSKPEQLISNHLSQLPSIGKEPLTKAILIFVINQQPSVSKDHAVLEMVPEQRNPEVQYVNYIAPQQYSYDPQQSQAHNQYWADILAPTISKPAPTTNIHPLIMQEQQHGTGNLLTYLEQELRMAQNMNSNNKLPTQPNLAPNRYPYPTANHLPPYYYPNRANLLAYTLPAILGRISNAPPPAESGTEFKLKLKGLV